MVLRTIEPDTPRTAEREGDFEEDEEYDDDEDVFQMEDEGDGYSELDQTVDLPSGLDDSNAGSQDGDYGEMEGLDGVDEEEARLRLEHAQAKELDDTYEVTLHKGDEGLCMNLGERQGKVRVIEFRPLPNGGQGSVNESYLILCFAHHLIQFLPFVFVSGALLPFA